jgi:hypothetical protein
MTTGRVTGCCDIATIQPAPPHVVNARPRQHRPPALSNHTARSRELHRPTVDNHGENRHSTCERAVDDRRNPGDSWKVQGITLGIQKYPLTWCFSSANVSTRTGERTPTGAGKPGRSRPIFGSEESDHGPGPRGESGSGRGKKPHASTHRATGQPEVTDGEVSGPTASRAPQLRGTEATRAARVRWHGQPGQRERRRGASRSRVTGHRGRHSGNGVRFGGQPGRGLRQRSSLRRATGSERHPRRATDVAPQRQRSRVRPADRVSTPVTEVGSPAAEVGAVRTTGCARKDVPNGSRNGFVPIDWPKNGIARRDPLGGQRRAMD